MNWPQNHREFEFFGLRWSRGILRGLLVRRQKIITINRQHFDVILLNGSVWDTDPLRSSTGNKHGNPIKFTILQTDTQILAHSGLFFFSKHSTYVSTYAGISVTIYLIGTQ